MLRIAAATLGLALLAGAASAADTVEYKVALAGKSPAEVRLAIQTAAGRACDEAYPENGLQFWTQRELKACKAEAAQAAQVKADAILAAHGSR